MNNFKFNSRYRTTFYSIFIFILLLFIFFYGLLINENQLAPDFSNKNLSPSIKYWFGTDWLGRNLFTRTIKGLSTSIVIGVSASTISAIIATTVGIIAAKSSGFIDSIILWIIDLFLSIPHLVLLIFISFAFGGGMKGLFISISFTHWPTLARVIRGEVLYINTQDYIFVSRKLGHNSLLHTFKHMVPQILPQFFVGLVLLFPHAILHESALSFLGYGLPPEKASIGIILSESFSYLVSGLWWPAILPGSCLVLIVILFDTLATSIKNILDPYNSHL